MLDIQVGKGAVRGGRARGKIGWYGARESDSDNYGVTQLRVEGGSGGS